MCSAVSGVLVSLCLRGINITFLKTSLALMLCNSSSSISVDLRSLKGRRKRARRGRGIGGEGGGGEGGRRGGGGNLGLWWRGLTPSVFDGKWRVISPLYSIIYSLFSCFVLRSFLHSYVVVVFLVSALISSSFVPYLVYIVFLVYKFIHSFIHVVKEWR